jgi:hypothetical protein
MPNGNKTFMRITNRDIYEKLAKLEETVAANHEQTNECVVRLAGKASLNFWIATSALGFAAGVAGFLTMHILGG